MQSQEAMPTRGSTARRGSYVCVTPLHVLHPEVTTFASPFFGVPKLLQDATDFTISGDEDGNSREKDTAE